MFHFLCNALPAIFFVADSKNNQGDVHRLANATKHATAVLDADISGLISLALALGAPGSVSTLRQIIAKILAEECAVIHDLPPENTVSYRQAVFNLFLPIDKVDAPRRKQNTLRRYIISYYLNGDLRQQQPQHYCCFSCCQSFESTVHRMAKYVTWALVPTKPAVFTRSRWTKYDLAIDWVGILAGVHHLLEKVLPKFLGGRSPKPPPISNASAVDDVLDNQLCWDELYGSNSAENTPQPLGNVNVDDGMGGQQQQQDYPEGQQQEQEQQQQEQQSRSWADFNIQQRTVARDWIATNPFLRLCILKDGHVQFSSSYSY